MESFNNYNFLGFFNPFYINNKEKIIIKTDFSETIKTKNDNKVIDEVSVIEILTKGYILGDRTLIKKVYKSPWMAKLNFDNTKWEYFTDIKFDTVVLEKKEIADKLFVLLKEELLNYIGEKKNIGILLSGGMDSRIVAGVLDTLIKEKRIVNPKVTAFTWGNKNSRDVVYAKRIAKRLGWSFKHYELKAEDLLYNIEETAKRGCDYSPINLHTMLKVRAVKGIDCILAGSFGDSIGRGEYSGKKVLQLSDLRKNINNGSGFFKKGIINDYMKSIDQDIESYWKMFPQKEKFQQIEQDYHIHYMRRMLNPCMLVINEKIPLCQCFTSPKIVKFIWSLNPVLRNDDIYKEILIKFKTDLTDIPWARTGLRYGVSDGVPDNYDKSHHSYSKFINEDIYEEIKNLALSENIARLNIFNMKAIENTFSQMKSSNYIRDIRIEAKLIWLASLSRFIDLYHIDLKSKTNKEKSVYDYLNTYIPFKNNLVNVGKVFYRKMLNK